MTPRQPGVWSTARTDIPKWVHTATFLTRKEADLLATMFVRAHQGKRLKGLYVGFCSLGYLAGFIGVSDPRRMRRLFFSLRVKGFVRSVRLRFQTGKHCRSSNFYILRKEGTRQEFENVCAQITIEDVDGYMAANGEYKLRAERVRQANSPVPKTTL